MTAATSAERVSSRLSTSAAVRVLVVVFVASRIVYRAVGVRFDDSPLTWYYQYAPLDLLKHEPARTLWWFHAQPPGFNAFLAAIVQLPESMWGGAFQIAFLACGLALAIGMFLLATDLGVPNGVALIVAAVLTVSPSFIAYENILFYPLPIATLLIFTFLGLLRYLQRGATAWGVVGVGCAALLVLTRATYHAFWLIALVGVALVARRDLWRRTAALAAIPLVLGVGLYVKNEVLFGQPTGSTWLGMNLAHALQLKASLPRMQELVQEHELRGPLETPAFSPLSSYADAGTAHTGVAVLDQPVKPQPAPAGVNPNFNNDEYIKISNQYLRDDRRFIAHHPGVYVATIGRAFELWLQPATNQNFVRGNVAHIRVLDQVFSRVVWLDVAGHHYPTFASDTRASLGEVSWTVVAIYLALVAAAVLLLVELIRRRTLSSRRWIVLAASATVLVVTLFGNALELGENSRFRIETDPLAVVVGAAVLCYGVRVATSARTVARERSEIA